MAGPRSPDRRDKAVVLGIAIAAFFVLYLFWPQPKKPTEQELEAEFALVPIEQGGFPVPPMDLVVPPTPRSLDRSLQLTGPTTQEEAPHG